MILVALGATPARSGRVPWALVVILVDLGAAPARSSHSTPRPCGRRTPCKENEAVPKGPPLLWGDAGIGVASAYLPSGQFSGGGGALPEGRGVEGAS